MASSLLSPGVYVQQFPSQVSTIAGASTSVAGFIGVVPNLVTLPIQNVSFNPLNPSSKRFSAVDHAIPTPAGQAEMVTSWGEFVRKFGDLVGNAADPANTATDPPLPDAGYLRLAHAVFGFFANGGSRCWVIRITDATTGLEDALATLDGKHDISIVCAPGLTEKTQYSAIVTHCENAGDRFAILDGPQLETNLDKLIDTTATGDAPANTDTAAWYYPWIKVFDPATQVRNGGDGLLAVPPSGHLAGIYARVDTERGVFKAPANEAIRGALDVTHALGRSQQDSLNPKGVNAIRLLNGGVRVWGARTIGGNDNGDLRYINVKRTLLFLQRSLDDGLQWAVFEPNTPALRLKVVRNVSAFLTTFWRAGGLFGNTPQEAFFVRCDANNNSDDDIRNGILNTDIGVAIVRPAEFVVFRVSQPAGVSL